MADTTRSSPNPVLKLLVEPKRKPSSGGGKGTKNIRKGSDSPEHREALSGQLNDIYRRRADIPTFGGKVQLVASMFENARAKYLTPTALFSPRNGARLIAPLKKGYLVETDVDELPSLMTYIKSPSTSVGGKVDISNVEKMEALGPEEVLRGSDIDTLWSCASDYENGKKFIAYLAPFHAPEARESLVEELKGLVKEKVLLPTSNTILPSDSGEAQEFARQYSLSSSFERYHEYGRAQAIVIIPSKEALSRIVASGTVWRLDPVGHIGIIASSGKSDSKPPPANLLGEPIVGIVDGDCSDKTYDRAEAGRAPALVPDEVTDHMHGNRVTAIEGGRFKSYPPDQINQGVNRNANSIFLSLGTIYGKNFGDSE